VFSFDEKAQVQALDRTQPSLPMKPGRAGTRAHDDKRHGITGLFAAMNVATSEALYDTRRRHTADDVLRFFRLIDLDVEKDLDVHVVLDDLSTHKALSVVKWLAHPQQAADICTSLPPTRPGSTRSRAGFSLLTKRRLEQGVFTSVVSRRFGNERGADTVAAVAGGSTIGQRGPQLWSCSTTLEEGSRGD
jgi:hypothetical protein